MTSSHHCIPNITTYLEERFPSFLPPTNTIFLHHHLPPSDHHDVERATAAIGVCSETTAASVSVGVDAVFSSWSWDEDDHKAGGTLQSIVDQAATRLDPKNVSSTIFHDGNKMINDDINTWLANSTTPQSITSNTSVDITTTMAVNSTVFQPSKNHDDHQMFMQVTDSNSVVITSDTHGTPKIEQYRNEEEDKNEIYAHMNNYVVSSKCKDERMKSVVDDQDNPSGTTDLLNHSISRPSPMRERRKQAGKRNTISSSVFLDANSSIKRSKATILHNKAEHKRRNKINQRVETLQKLVPNICCKTDKATILDQAIEYIKKLQNQRDHMIMRRSYEMINNMMIPMSYYTIIQQQQQEEQQLQMSRMAMAGAQMDMCLDFLLHTNQITHPNISTTRISSIPAIVHPSFLVPPPDNHSTFLIPPCNNHF